MNKRLKKKHSKRLEWVFNLRNVVGHENDWDFCESFGGDLYKGNRFIINFYEPPIEGGYYPNGEPSDKKAYEDFLNATRYQDFNCNCDELELFNKGVSLLLSKVIAKKNYSSVTSYRHMMIETANEYA